MTAVDDPAAPRVRGDIAPEVSETLAPQRRPRRGLLVVLSVIVAFGAGLLAGGLADRAPGASSVDVGFLQDMSDHHDQAVQLALIQLSSGDADAVKGFALDVIALQRYEIGLMEARLRDWGHGRGEIPRDAMVWMGHPVPLAAMAGMASPDDLAEFAAARGPDADARFIRLMTEHHEGGIHMAEHAWQHAATAEVRGLAQTIAKLQLVEIRDLQRLRMQLGLPE